MVSYGRKITTRSYPDLGDSLRMLMDDRWITYELTTLFDSAIATCKAEEQ
jgi:hypothetical protein